MYDYLTGKIVSKNPARLVLDVQGTGYEIFTTLSTFSSLPSPGSEIRIYTHFVVREDAQQFYGFISEDERSLFRLLISVSGIGPRLAATALSGVEPARLRRAIVEGAVDVLKGIPGVGRKTAERMIVELREKITVEGAASAETADVTVPGDAGGRLLEDSLQALMALGYKRPNARKAIEKVIKDKPEAAESVESLIRSSLQYV